MAAPLANIGNGTLRYIGRFAPSPTGYLHAGSLVAALASWLDARSHGGTWLVRMEDVDQPRCIPGAGEIILSQLAACGLYPDQPVVWQSQRTALYQQALALLQAQQWVYPCTCSRKDILTALQTLGEAPARHEERVYPGTCRPNSIPPTLNPNVKHPTWRFNTTAYVRTHQLQLVHWQDRWLGPQQQNVTEAVGDFALQRSDAYFTYQLAMVVDDAQQGVTHVVRGADLADNTARQLLLQQALNLPAPQYLHTPLVLGEDGAKLSKQNGAIALNTSDPLKLLNTAAQTLGLQTDALANTTPLHDWLHAAVLQWAARFGHTDMSDKIST